MGEEGGEEMSCDKCEEMQDSGAVAYYRWGKANIGMTGCDEHLKEIFEVLGKAQKEGEKKNA